MTGDYYPFNYLEDIMDLWNKLDIYQALWGMEGIPTPERSYTIEKQIELIVKAGFHGALNFIDDSSKESLLETYRVSKLVQSSGLKLGLSCNGFNLNDIMEKIDYAGSIGAEYINIMVKSYFVHGKKAVDLLKETLNYGKRKGVEVFIETHRSTVTQDLHRTVNYVKAIDEIPLTIDLSHYIVAGEFTLENLDFYGSQLEPLFDVLLQHTASLHIRLSNGEQVQVPLNRISTEHLMVYKGWWRKGLHYAVDRLVDGEKIPVIIELGPEDYQQKIWHEGKWIYDCDRFEEALKCKKLIEQL